MIIDLWTVALFWAAIGLVYTAAHARKWGEVTLADLITNLVIWPGCVFTPLIALVLKTDDVVLWKREAARD